MEKLSSSKGRIILSYLILILILGTAMGLPLSNNAVQSHDKLIIPAMARKAGGRFKPELITDTTTESTTTNQETPEDSKQYAEDYNYDDWFDESSSEELECSDEMYYHQLGRQCVPIRCPGGNKWRDPMNGDCVYYYPAIREGWGRTANDYYNNPIPNQSHSRTSPIVWRTPLYRYQGRKLMKG